LAATAFEKISGHAAGFALTSPVLRLPVYIALSVVPNLAKVMEIHFPTIVLNISLLTVVARKTVSWTPPSGDANDSK
jgi:hypothetical protein